MLKKKRMIMTTKKILWIIAMIFFISNNILVAQGWERTYCDDFWVRIARKIVPTQDSSYTMFSSFPTITKCGLTKINGHLDTIQVEEKIAAGIYLMKITNKDGAILVKRFIKS